jgi:hypothetical protein
LHSKLRKRPIGIDLSAHTGYNTSAKINFKFHAAGHLCGTNDVPGCNPKRMLAEG